MLDLNKTTLEKFQDWFLFILGDTLKNTLATSITTNINHVTGKLGEVKKKYSKPSINITTISNDDLLTIFYLRNFT